MRDVYHGPVINQAISEQRTVTYEIEHNDMAALERWSMFLMRHLGYRRTLVSTIISFAIGGTSALSGIYGKLGPYAQVGVVVGFVGVGIGISFMVALKHRTTSRCPNCHVFYAMREVGTPTIQETDLRRGSRRITRRTYQCKFCHHQEEEVTHEEIRDQDGADGE